MVENEQQMFVNQPLNTQYGNSAGNSLLHSYESIIRFKVNKDEIVKKDYSKEPCLESSEFNLNEVTWKVQVCKRKVTVKEDEKEKEEDYASVELVSMFSGETATWSCNAEVDVKLIAIKEGKDDLKNKIKDFTYSKKNSVGKNEKFIKWDDFNDDYLKEKMATFVFNIKTKSLNRSAQLEQTTAKFHLRVKQVSSLTSEFSNELTLRGIRWKINASKLDNHFAIFVVANENDIDTDAEWLVTAKVKLTSTKDDKTIEREFNNKDFNWSRTNLGFKTYLEWSKFTDKNNGYIRNNAALIEIELEVKPKPKSS